ncbi:MAG: hypothetical protein Q9179_005442 [Wetmoreana sp. 5 TL-2023]
MEMRLLLIPQRTLEAFSRQSELPISHTMQVLLSHCIVQLFMPQISTVGVSRPGSCPSGNEFSTGVTGLDGTDLLPKAFIPPVEDGDAIVAMREALMAEPAGQPWLVATGALTNISLLFTAFPELAEHIKGLSIMGGAIGGGFTNAQLGHIRGEGQVFGNTTPRAEFNIYCDPEAAQSIFSNPILAPKTTLVTLDLSHQVLANTAIQDSLLHGPPNGTPKDDLVIRQLFHDLLVFFANTYKDVFGISEGPPLHDSLAVAVVLADIGAENLAFDDRGGERWGVTVVTGGLHSELDEVRSQLGRTVTLQTNSPGVRIPRGLDIAAFWEVVEQCLQRAEALECNIELN